MDPSELPTLCHTLYTTLTTLMGAITKHSIAVQTKDQSNQIFVQYCMIKQKVFLLFSKINEILVVLNETYKQTGSCYIEASQQLIDVVEDIENGMAVEQSTIDIMKERLKGVFTWATQVNSLINSTPPQTALASLENIVVESDPVPVQPTVETAPVSDPIVVPEPEPVVTQPEPEPEPVVSQPEPELVSENIEQIVAEPEIDDESIQAVTELNWNEEKRKVIAKFAASEQQYAQQLKVLIDSYYHSLQKNSNDKAISKLTAEVETGFQGFDELFSFHNQFHMDLEEAKKDKTEIAPIFQRLAEVASLYLSFAQSFQQRMMAINVLARRKTQLIPRSSTGHDIIFLVTLPFNRFSRYERFMKEIINSLSMDDPERESLLNSSRNIIGDCQEIKRYQMDYMQIVSESFPDKNGFKEVFAAHRYFIRDGLIEANSSHWKKSKKCLVTMFNDLLLFGTEKKSSGFTKSKDVTKSGGKRDKKPKKGKRDKMKTRSITITERTLINMKEYYYAGEVSLRNCDINFTDDVIMLKAKDSAENFQLVFESKSIVTSWYDNLIKWKKILDEPEITLIEGISSTQLRVKLIGGKLLQRSTYDAPDIQVFFYIGSSTAESTLKKNCRVNPNWDDEFVFVLNDQFSETLNILVRDMKTSVKLGENTINLRNHYEGIETKLWIKLQDSAGSIYLSLTVGSVF